MICKIVKITKIMLLVVMANTYFLFAQTIKSSGSSRFDALEKMQQTTMLNTKTDELLKESFPVGNTLDPDNYYIGPNDLLLIQIIPGDIATVPSIVTSECTIVHKNFGEINVKGLTLSEVRELFNEIQTSKGLNSKVILSLTQPRMVLVDVRGNVVNPRVYVYPASYSVSTAIKYANQIQHTTTNNKDEQSAMIRLQELQKDREKLFSESGISEMSLYGNRNIRLIRDDGTAKIVDLERAVVTNDSEYDPCIKEGDVIVVPFEPNNFPVISITGAVLRPASVVYKEGDMASHLLKMGYGFTENVDINNVYIYDAMGNSNRLNVDSAGNLIGNDFPITSGSVIVVGNKVQPYNNVFGTVSVKGEVNNPNIYIIEIGKTRLQDVIEMAGNFTQDAYLPLAEISRRDNLQLERTSQRRKYSEYFQHSNLTQQDTMRTAIAMDMKKSMVSSDFVACFIDKNEEYNLILHDGDVINVPKSPHQVNVFGHVKSPGFIDFKENQTMEWYINRVGGYTKSADKERSRIIRGTNKVWIDGFDKDVFVYDGDEIYVPAPRDVAPEVKVSEWYAWAGILGVAVTLINVAWNIYYTSKR